MAKKSFAVIGLGTCTCPDTVRADRGIRLLHLQYENNILPAPIFCRSDK